MRQIDADDMVILCSGDEWTHSMLPCCRDAISLLERNERLVTWLMPAGGDIKEQVPAIRFKGQFYSLSLRMMKAIYRHVRLHKNFVNVEKINGVYKQRIPELLLREKIRTQSRFDAMRKLSCVASVNKKAGQKITSTVAAKMKTFVENGLMELAENPSTLPACTYFSHSHPNVIEEFLYEFYTDFPEIVEEKCVFMAQMSDAYDTFMSTLKAASARQDGGGSSKQGGT